MNIELMIQAFSRLTEKQQAIILTRFAFEMTIVAREAYLPGDGKDDACISAREINELQHRVTSAILARLTGDPQRYPDDVLVHMCVDTTDNPLARTTCPIFTRLLSAMAPDPHRG